MLYFCCRATWLWLLWAEIHALKVWASQWGRTDVLTAKRGSAVLRNTRDSMWSHAHRLTPDSVLVNTYTNEYFDNKNDEMCSLFVQNVSWSGQVRLNTVNNFIWNCCNKQFSPKAQKSFAALIKQVASESTPQSIKRSSFPRTIGFKQTDKKKMP